jgi:hypothetical protein
VKEKKTTHLFSNFPNFAVQTNLSQQPLEQGQRGLQTFTVFGLCGDKSDTRAFEGEASQDLQTLSDAFSRLVAAIT